MRVDIDFDCYLYTYGNDEKVTLFQFFPGGDWDEDKLTLEEALKKYPPTQFNWLKIKED